MPEDFLQPDADERALRVYMLGCVDFDAALRLQRRLHFDVAGARDTAALMVCEHFPAITVGRQGSRSHIHLEDDELDLRGWPIHWVNRGSGCVLHVPGQLALYSILPLDRLGLGITEYVQLLGRAIADVLGDFSVEAEPRGDGVWTGDRRVAALGVSVRDWISGYGAYVNIHAPVDLLRRVAGGSGAMTSLERERGGPVRPSLVRERLIEHFRLRFGFARVALFSDHPALERSARRPPAAVRDLERV